MKRKNILKTSLDILIISIGAFIIAVGLKVFFIPRGITAGGFSGLAIVFSFLLEKVFGFVIPIGVLTLLFNVPIFILGLKNKGLRFVLYSIWATIIFSVLVDLIPFKIEVEEGLLALLYGSLLIGFGIGVIIRVDASTGGSDMLAVILSQKFKRLTTGTIIIAIDGIVVLISIFTFSIQSALYSLLAIFITGKIIDMVITGFKNYVAYYIISNRYDEISNRIMEELKRGVTCMDGTGMYTKTDRKVIVVILTKLQIVAFKKLVKELDENAFMFSVNVHEALGLNKYTAKKDETEA